MNKQKRIWKVALEVIDTPGHGEPYFTKKEIASCIVVDLMYGLRATKLKLEKQ